MPERQRFKVTVEYEIVRSHPENATLPDTPGDVHSLRDQIVARVPEAMMGLGYGDGNLYWRIDPTTVNVEVEE